MLDATLSPMGISGNSRCRSKGRPINLQNTVNVLTHSYQYYIRIKDFKIDILVHFQKLKVVIPYNSITGWETLALYMATVQTNNLLLRIRIIDFSEISQGCSLDDYLSDTFNWY